MPGRPKPLVLDQANLAAVETAAPTARIVEQSSEKVKISLPDESATIEVLLFGATIVSWTVKGQEKLFVSEKAKLDGSKAVRGGIPLVFPVFGTAESGPTATLPQHGLARIAKWELLGSSRDEDTSTVDFGLGWSSLPFDLQKNWPFEFSLIYSITLSKDKLGTKMLVRNESLAESPSAKPFDFQILFHTYFRVADISSISVQGLKEATGYYDKVKKADSTTSDAAEGQGLKIDSETDRVYKNVPHGQGKYVVISADGKDAFSVERHNLEDVVVWNPWTNGTRIADFGPDDGYKNMLCIESGSVAGWQRIDAGETWEGGQVIKALM